MFRKPGGEEVRVWYNIRAIIKVEVGRTRVMLVSGFWVLEAGGVYVVKGPFLFM